MKKEVRVATEYGPLGIELTYCDNPDCTSRGIEQYLVNWFKLSPQGMSAHTMMTAQFTEDQDFCGLACLKKVI